MRIVFVAIGAFGLTGAAAQSRVKNDSIYATHVSGQVQISNLGFAPVPAFSFNSPIVIGLLSIKKKHFSFEPDLAVGLNGKPWMANNWFRLIVAERKAWRMNVGLNPSFFFKSEKHNSGDEVVHAYRNLTVEVAAERQISGWGLRLTYQRIRAFDSGTLSGNFLDLTCPVTITSGKERFSVYLQPQVFYFNFDGNIDGFFTSATVIIKHKRLPLSLYTQGVLPLWTNFPGKSFKWNFGVFVTFK